jgi:hypothetical protein
MLLTFVIALSARRRSDLDQRDQRRRACRFEETEQSATIEVRELLELCKRGMQQLGEQ